MSDDQRSRRNCSVYFCAVPTVTPTFRTPGSRPKKSVTSRQGVGWSSRFRPQGRSVPFRLYMGNGERSSPHQRGRLSPAGPTESAGPHGSTGASSLFVSGRVCSGSVTLRGWSLRIPGKPQGADRGSAKSGPRAPNAGLTGTQGADRGSAPPGHLRPRSQ